jgi:DNA mismatch endonuclease (patch repair protein)
MDKLSADRRSENMRRIRSAGMKPEILVRRLAHELGYRFRLHRRDLPGKPDLVFVARRKVIFVHGCFWHQHRHCVDGRLPKSNKAYWKPKLSQNVKRDASARARLARAGWRSLVIWECETMEVVRLQKRLRQFLG